MRYRLNQRRSHAWLIVGALVLLLICFLGYRQFIANKPETAQQKMQQLVSTISEFMMLPTDEEPSLATVADVNKLPKQPFYTRAENGDQVLLYTKNRLAILYRPSTKKIVNIGPIDGEVSFVKFSAAIRDGTGQPRFIEAAASAVAASFPNANIVEKAAAGRMDFPTTIVVPTTTEKQDLAAQVAAGIGAQVGVLPVGETAPNSDVLIIIGADYGQPKKQ